MQVQRSPEDNEIDASGTGKLKPETPVDSTGRASLSPVREYFRLASERSRLTARAASMIEAKPGNSTAASVVYRWLPSRSFSSVVERRKIPHMNFRVELEQEDDGRWIAEVVDLPGVLAYGNTAEEAKAKVQALALRS